MVLDVDIVGRDLAGLVLRVASAGSTANIPPVEDRLVPTFDWRALRRWNISERSLPAGSSVLFREVTLWDEYRNYIIGALALVVVQSGFIAGLYGSRARRRRAEAALRQSYDRNRDLAGRLINAQEAERSRIARDLHDDVSQQLAGLSIMMSGLKQKIGKQQHDAELDESVTTIQELTTTLARSVRNLSHELHPNVLEHAGLVPTLRRHCAEIARLYSIGVEFHADHDMTTLGHDHALCLFRVAQEAITNTVRHAWARTVRVRLREHGQRIELTVADDGVGFVPDQKTGAGLGLRSIDERVRLVHGSVVVDSSVGVGTTVLVRIPKGAA
jgi:signal transduction histidine kinase